MCEKKFDLGSSQELFSATKKVEIPDWIRLNLPVAPLPPLQRGR